MSKLDTLIITGSIKLAAHWHGDQKDAGGVPYIYHPIAVGQSLYYAGEEAIVVAAGHLHDVVEDTPCTLSEIESYFTYARGFGDDDSLGKEIATLVDYLTHRKGRETHREYIHRVCEDIRAVKIKIKDIEHNLDPSRPHPNKAGLDKRYRSALSILYDYLHR